MIYVYCPYQVSGLQDLLNSLSAQRVSRFDGESFWNKKARFIPEPGSVLIPLGATLPQLDKVKVLNAMDCPRNKFQVLGTLSNTLGKSSVLRTVKADAGVNASTTLLPRKFKSLGLVADIEYLHIRPQFTDYYVYRESFTRQVRIHSFNGKSIRAGEWVMAGSVADDTIRTEATGWKINYAHPSTVSERALAHRAVKLLDMQYGVVDLGINAAGSGMVLQVTTIPDLSTPGAVAAYTKAINKFIEGTSNAV